MGELLTQERLSRSERIAAGVACLCLTAFYLRTLGRPSLWLDEAWEANYYVGHVAEPWMNRPILYMAGQKLAAALAGPQEFALRLLPCLAGLAAVATLWLLVRREIGKIEAWLAAGLLAFGPAFLLQSHQLKHYPFDALATTILLLAYAWWRETRSGARAAAFAGVAVVCFGVSFTVPMVLAGLAMVAVVSGWGDRRGVARFLAASAAAAMVGLLIYESFHAVDAREDLLREYWSTEFLPWKEPARAPAWLLRASLGILKDHTGVASGVGVSLLVAAGVIAVPRGGRYLFGAWVGAAAANAALSAVGKYPFGSARLSLYLAPFIAVAVACGFGALLRDGPARMARVLAVVALGYPWFYGAAVGAAPYFSTGWQFEDIRELVNTLDRERRPGEAVYVHEDAVPAFVFYWRRLGHAPPYEDVVWANARRADPPRHAEGVAQISDRYARVWGLYTHAPPEEIRALRKALSERYDLRQERFVEPDAWLDLWERKGAGTDP